MSAPSCETCAHWKFDRADWEFDDLRFGECKRIRQREDVTRTDEEGNAT